MRVMSLCGVISQMLAPKPRRTTVLLASYENESLRGILTLHAEEIDCGAEDLTHVNIAARKIGLKQVRLHMQR